MAYVDSADLAGTGAGQGASMVGFVQAKAGAVPATVEGKLRETVSVRDFGAVGDGVVNDTAAINAMLAAMGGSGSTGFYRTRFPYGGYCIDQLRFDMAGARHEFDQAILIGTAISPKKSAVDLRAGQSWHYGLKVKGPFSATAYECGVHHYTNDLALYNPGYLDVHDAYVEGFELGWAIGALPSQGGVIPKQIPDQNVHAPDDVAIDAPLSELTYTNPKIEFCPKGLRMEQPNGKVTIVGGRIHSESKHWAGYDTTQTYAVEIANAGSELSLVGGTVEHVQGGEDGACLKVLDGTLHANNVTIETTVSHYVAGSGVLRLTHIQNNGLNAVTRGYLEVHSGATGTFEISNSPILWPYGRVGTDGPGFRAVSGLAGETAINLNFVCKFDKVSLDGAPVSFSGGYRPIVKGLRSIFRDCELLSRSFPEANILYRYRLHDGEDRLMGAVDRNGASMGAFAMSRTSATVGGWNLTVAGPCGYGFVTAGLPSIAGIPVASALRLESVAGGGTISAQTPILHSKHDGLELLRGFIRTGASSANIRIRAYFYRFGVAAPTATSDIFLGMESQFGSAWQPLLLAFPAPADCEDMRIEIYCENGAWIELCDLKLT